jgi:hypothetical protein
MPRMPATHRLGADALGPDGTPRSRRNLTLRDMPGGGAVPTPTMNTFEILALVLLAIILIVLVARR